MRVHGDGKIAAGSSYCSFHRNSHFSLGFCQEGFNVGGQDTVGIDVK